MSIINDKENSKNHRQSSLKKIFNNIMLALKNIFSSRIIIALIFLVVGSVATYSCTNKDNHKKHYKQSYSFFEDEDDDFDGFHDDFFAEFETLHRKMESAMRHHRKMMEKAFEEINEIDEDDKNFSKAQFSRVQASLQHHQDDKSHNFELQFSGIKPEDISVVIEKNYLVFSAKKAEISSAKNDDKSLQSSASSDFYYATYLPEYDDKIAPEIIKNNDKISVKLAKKIIKNEAPKKDDNKKTKTSNSKPLKS